MPPTRMVQGADAGSLAGRSLSAGVSFAAEALPARLPPLAIVIGGVLLLSEVLRPSGLSLLFGLPPSIVAEPSPVGVPAGEDAVSQA